MAPIFPTTLALISDHFPKGYATAMAIAITCGWIGLLLSSPAIGWLASLPGVGLRSAMLLLPAGSLGIAVVALLIATTAKPRIRNFPNAKHVPDEG